MKLSARAKINLGLDILGRRPDGYHSIRTVMQTIDLADTLEVERSDKPGVLFETDSPQVPSDERNLAWRAAALLLERYAPEAGVRLYLEKHIPVEAGMAGGSTDAAAALVGVNDLLGLGLSRQTLCELGAELGADVPFCVLGGTALAEGIGEKLTPLPPLPDCTILLCKPPVQISTARAYRELDSAAYDHPDMEGILAAIRAKDVPAMAARLGNVFEPGAVSAFPVIREIARTMEEGDALAAAMSGSGPTVFGIFADLKAAEKSAAALKEAFPEAFTALTRPHPGQKGAAL